jgi:hypothetical protein
MVKYLNFHNSSFASRYFVNVNGKATVRHTSCLHNTQLNLRLAPLLKQQTSPISLHHLLCATGDGFRSQVSCFVLLGLPHCLFCIFKCLVFCLDFDPFFFFPLLGVLFIYSFLFLNFIYSFIYTKKINNTFLNKKLKKIKLKKRLCN